jgi:hypothetical protein
MMTGDTFGTIRTILVADWDPLDIGSNINLHDEYDSVVQEIMSTPQSERQGKEIYDILLRAEQSFEISPIDFGRLERTSRRILEITG